MDTIKKNYAYYVVQFDESTKDNLPLIDLVPKSWVVSTSDGLRCQFPNVSDATVQRWVKNQKEPGPDWGDYAVVRIVMEARDYDQGLRRLKRSMKNAEPAPSTDTENNNDTTLTLLDSLAERQLLSYLDKESPLPFNDDLRLSNIFGGTSEVGSSDKGSPIKKNDAQADRNGNDDLKRYFEEKLNEVKLELLRKIESAKRSIQYDLEKKINEMNNNIMFSSRSTSQHSSDARKKINAPLPFTNLEDFLTFERSLQDDDKETTKALITLLKSSISGTTSVQKDIGVMIGTVIGKAVQIKYSGCGRKVKNVETKLNFSATSTFGCMKEILREKYPDGPELVGLSTKLSRWFAGAGDRDGGRRERQNQTLTPTATPATPTATPATLTATPSSE